ncbi:MAG: AAA family ATPase [Candidatus Binatia bacterium]
MYERFFGLVDAPFRLTPDPRYLFRSRKHAEALAHLRLGLRESGFVCITGDVGTGKTTLLRAFLAQLGPDVRAAYVFNPALSSLELLQTICAEFGLPATSASPKQLIDGLNAHLLAERQAGRRCVVVVDEAQALAIDVLEQLRLLSNLETSTEKLLRIILVGQPQLQRLLLHPELVQLNQRITLRWHMGPLDRAETAAYVRHRLAVASGGQARRLFSPPALGLVHRLSGGVPRLVNMLAHRALLAAFAAERRSVTRAAVRRAHRELATIPLPARPGTAWRAGVAVAGIGAALGVIGLVAREAIRNPTTFGIATAVAPAPVTAPKHDDPVPALAAALEPPPPEPRRVALADRLAGRDAEVSARSALDAVLAAWHAAPLAADESPDLAMAARRRNLQDLALAGNLSMLHLLDLPAILELPVAPDGGTRYVALVGMEDGRLQVDVHGERLTLEPSDLERAWLGRAHVLWRDFEHLGPAPLAADPTGEGTRRVQALLRRAGLDPGADGAPAARVSATVTDFQRSRLLQADGLVGPLTSIALYGAAGGYARPTLAGGGGG